jgi:hypothetical protein
VKLAKEYSNEISGVLWAGDLNFRSVGTEAPEFRDIVERQSPEKMMEIVEKHDQLFSLREIDGIFNFIDEAPINFMPTYRFIVRF